MIPRKIANSASISSEATLGEGVQICARASIAKNCVVKRHCFVNQGCVLHAGCRLGPFCSLGRHMEIGGAEHRIDTLSTHTFVYTNQSLRSSAPYRRATPPGARVTEIGADVWLGGRAIVKRGVEIGHGAVVGAGAVVTKNVPPYAIVAGVPARLVRMRFDPVTVRGLLETAWWERPLEEILALPFDDIAACIETLRCAGAHLPADGMAAA